MRILLLRHGEAERGDSGTPRPDFGLTPLGRKQIESICFDRHLPIDQVLTSPLPRARESAAIVSAELGHREPTVVPTLAEIGEFGSGQESFPTFVRRVLAFFDQVAVSQTPSTLAVTHGGFIMASIRGLFDIPTPGTGARFEPRSASLTEWRFENGSWELSSFNVTVAT